MGSIFLSLNYKPEPVTRSDIYISSIAWGFTLGFSFLTCVTAGRQTWTVWKRTKRVSTYIVLIWSEMIVSTAFGFICWFYLAGSFPPSFAFFFCILTLWALQVQFLLQIIINRIGLLIMDKRKVWWIKWGTAAFITAINISVYNIWIPARLQINENYVEINEWWDRVEKGLYLIIDGCLNAYFLWLVKTRLLSTGMNKYWPLFRFNAAIVIVSLSMDVLIIAMMSLKNTFVYMQFHPVAYIVKLKIEMTMAELIVKVAREPNAHEVQYTHSSRTAAMPHHSFATNRRSAAYHGDGTDGMRTELEQFKNHRYHAWITADKIDQPDEKNTKTQDEESCIVERTVQHDFNDNVIVKTFETRVTSESMHQSETDSSETSSTVKLRN